MYIPKLFKNDNIDDIRDFVAEHGFAILVNRTDGKLWATHIPLILGTDRNGKDILHGHIAKANPQWKDFISEEEVLVIFTGSHAYISSSWYDHENVPTWNYTAVHMYGSIRILNTEELLASLEKLVNKYETGSEHPVDVKTMSKQVINENIHGLVGFEISISEVHSAKKLSQNRDDKNYEHIIHKLKEQNNENATMVAKSMEQNRKKNEY